MFEEAADDADDADVLADTRHSRPQAADPAHDEINVDTRQRSIVEVLNDLGVDERIHLANDSRRPAAARVLSLAIDHLGEALAHVARSDQQIAKGVFSREAGQ